MNGKLKVGTRIKFNKTLTEGACEDHPSRLYASKGEEGEITGHDCWEGYMVKRDRWPAPFGCELKDFTVIE